MLRAVLSTTSDFAIQRRENGIWRTLQEVNTLVRAQAVINGLGEPIHYTSIAVNPSKRIRPNQGGI